MGNNYDSISMIIQHDGSYAEKAKAIRIYENAGRRFDEENSRDVDDVKLFLEKQDQKEAYQHWFVENFLNKKSGF